MPRLSRIAIPGVPHHVTQRGNNRQDIFFTEEDRSFYLESVAKYSGLAGLEIVGYCLMTNHVHLVVVPHGEDSLAEGVGRAHWRYSQEINRLHGRTGHLWQGRFFSCALDEPHAYSALAYVERNPVRAKMVRNAWEYPWSSAGAHVALRAAPPWLDLARWSRWGEAAQWKAELQRGSKEGMEALRFHTRRGRPLGSDDFVAKMEALLGHRLRPLPIGRPKKSKEEGK
jgi:putative transposase